jgi:hypothetical protein
MFERCGLFRITEILVVSFVITLVFGKSVIARDIVHLVQSWQRLKESN